MKFTKSQIISFKVIILFTIAIFSTFIGDYLHSFFDDVYCKTTGCKYLSTNHTLPGWHWGYRHWLYLTMCSTLFIVQVCDIVSFAEADEHKA